MAYLLPCHHLLGARFHLEEMWQGDEKRGGQTGLEGEDWLVCDCACVMGIRGVLYLGYERDYVSGEYGCRGQ